MKTTVKQVAFEIKAIIAAELRHRMFSLKFDTATKYGRSVLGLNALFIENDQIQVRTLAMVTITQRHFSEHLKTEIENILEEYQCSIQQICSCTTDNGANMVKCVSLLENAQEEDIEGFRTDDITDEEFIGTFEDNVVYGTLQCMRCASHTLQVNY